MKPRRPFRHIARSVMPNRVRMDLRAPPLLREYILEAAQASYESVTSFVLKAAAARAHEIIRDPTRRAAVDDELRRLPYTRNV